MLRCCISISKSPEFLGRIVWAYETRQNASVEESLIMVECVNKKREAQAREEPAPHNTGNNLLSHNSGVVLPSAAESLTSVFEMGTCVSSRL